MRPHGRRARVSTTSPEAFAQCDRCGFWRNRSDLTFQMQWGGLRLYSNQILVCRENFLCNDVPQEQFRTIILPPDPPPVVNARVPNFGQEENLVLLNQYIVASPSGTTPPTTYEKLNPLNLGPKLILCDQSGTVALLAEWSNTQPTLPS